MPSFFDLSRQLTAAADTLGGVIRPVGDLEGYPMYRIEFGAPAGPAILIDAGIHGEEPAGPLGLAAWLETAAARWSGRLGFTILPCLNPHGFEHGTRSSRDTEDLNRHFDEPAAPLTELVTRAIAGRRFVLAIDMHEDADFDGAYLYELRAAPPFLGERLLATASATVPISGDFTTVRGLIRPPAGALRPAERRGWPIAIYHFAHASSHVVTMETPGHRPLDDRIAVHVHALDAACAYVAEQAGPVAGAGGPRVE